MNEARRCPHCGRPLEHWQNRWLCAICAVFVTTEEEDELPFGYDYDLETSAGAPDA